MAVVATPCRSVWTYRTNDSGGLAGGAVTTLGILPRAVWQYQVTNSAAWLTHFGLWCLVRRTDDEMRVIASRQAVAQHVGLGVESIKKSLGTLADNGLIERIHGGWLMVGDPTGYAPAPSAEILSRPMPAGYKRCLAGVWSFIEAASDGSMVAARTISELAERTGQTKRALRKQLHWLRQAGLVAGGTGWFEVITRDPNIPEPAPMIPAEDPNIPEPAPMIPAAQSTPAPAPPTRKKRKRPAAQTELTAGTLFDLGPVSEPKAERVPVDALADRPAAEQVGGLFDEWNRLRIAAGSAHAKKLQPLAKSNIRTRDIHRSIRDHGFAEVLRGLRFVGEEWARDVGALEKFSATCFSERSVARAVGLSSPHRVPRKVSQAAEGLGAGRNAKMMAEIAKVKAKPGPLMTPATDKAPRPTEPTSLIDLDGFDF